MTLQYMSGTEGVENSYLIIATNAGHRLGIRPILGASGDQVVVGFRIRAEAIPVEKEDGDVIETPQVKAEAIKNAFPGFTFSKLDAVRGSTVAYQTYQASPAYFPKLIEEIKLKFVPKVVQEITTRIEGATPTAQESDIYHFLDAEYQKGLGLDAEEPEFKTADVIKFEPATVDEPEVEPDEDEYTDEDSTEIDFD